MSIDFMIPPAMISSAITTKMRIPAALLVICVLRSLFVDFGAHDSHLAGCLDADPH
jgi:hypothetical protein